MDAERELFLWCTKIQAAVKTQKLKTVGPTDFLFFLYVNLKLLPCAIFFDILVWCLNKYCVWWKRTHSYPISPYWECFCVTGMLQRRPTVEELVDALVSELDHNFETFLMDSETWVVPSSWKHGLLRETKSLTVCTQNTHKARKDS